MTTGPFPPTRMAILAIAASLLAFPAPAAAQVDPARAIRNYQAVQSGQRPLSDLTPQERAEVAEVDRILRDRDRDRRTPAQRCRDAARGGNAAPPTPLEERLLDLRCSRR